MKISFHSSFLTTLSFFHYSEMNVCLSLCASKAHPSYGNLEQKRQRNKIFSLHIINKLHSAWHSHKNNFVLSFNSLALGSCEQISRTKNRLVGATRLCISRSRVQKYHRRWWESGKVIPRGRKLNFSRGWKMF